MGVGTPSGGTQTAGGGGGGCGVLPNPAILCWSGPKAVRPKFRSPELSTEPRPRTVPPPTPTQTPPGRLTHAHNSSRRPRPLPAMPLPALSPPLPVPPRISGAAHRTRSFSAARSKMADTQVGPARRWAAVAAIRRASPGGWGRVGCAAGQELRGGRSPYGWGTERWVGGGRPRCRGGPRDGGPGRRWGLGGPEAVCDAVSPHLRPNGRTRSSPRSSRTKRGPCWARAARRSYRATIRTSASALRHPRRYGPAVLLRALSLRCISWARRVGRLERTSEVIQFQPPGSMSRCSGSVAVCLHTKLLPLLLMGSF